MRLSASTTSGSVVGSGCFDSLNIVPRELMRLRIVALLFSVAMKSTYSAMRSAVAGRLGWSTRILADTAGVSVATVKKYEQQAGIPRANARVLNAIILALSNAGIAFTGDPLINPGVTLNISERDA